MLVMSLVVSLCLVSGLEQESIAQPEIEVVESESSEANIGGLVGITTGSPLADLNGDGIVDFFDVALFINCVQTGAACADLNGDGVVDFFDVQLFISLE